jgi:eukaryotic-like serine/threonine-protein kinase
MSTATPIDLLAALRQCRLLQPSQLDELARTTSKKAEPSALASRLVARGWLTPFQSDLLQRGRGDDLVMEPYIILDRLGEGRVGQIYKARHRTLERTVTLKIFRKDLTDYDVLARFYREVRLVSQLNHPNIVHAYDAGPIGGQHMIVMEHVVGTDLARYVSQRGPLPAGEACEYIRQAAIGLQHAHERGLVHRDIQPSNLLLTPPLPSGVPGAGQGNIVKILDLGLGRLRRKQERGDGNSQLTLLGNGAMEFTDYTAPEQALDFHEADIRADIYGLGGCLFLLLTGRSPVLPGTPGERLLRLQSSEPPALEPLRRDLPPGLSAVYRRMMACRVPDRYQTPAQVAQALAPLCTIKPLPVALPAGRPALAGRRLVVLGAVGAVLLLSVIGLWLLRPGASKAPAATQPVVAAATVRVTMPATQPDVPPPAPDRTNPTGTWKWTSGFGDREYTLKLRLDGDRLSGTLSRDATNAPIRDAKVEGGKLSFSATLQRGGQRFTTKYSGEVSGDTIKGQYVTEFGGRTRTSEWEAKRAKE